LSFPGFHLGLFFFLGFFFLRESTGSIVDPGPPGNQPARFERHLTSSPPLPFFPCSVFVPPPLFHRSFFPNVQYCPPHPPQKVTLPPPPQPFPLKRRIIPLPFGPDVLPYLVSPPPSQSVPPLHPPKTSHVSFPAVFHSFILPSIVLTPPPSSPRPFFYRQQCCWGSSFFFTHSDTTFFRPLKISLGFSAVCFPLLLEPLLPLDMHRLLRRSRSSPRVVSPQAYVDSPNFNPPPFLAVNQMHSPLVSGLSSYQNPSKFIK